MKLQDKISSTFPKIGLPCDLINNEGNFLKTNAKNWLEIEDHEISSCPNLLIYLDWKEGIYYLPRLMNWILDDIDGKIKPENQVDLYIFYWIIGNWEKLKKDLEIEKIKLVKEFLVTCQSDPDYSFYIKSTGINPKKYSI